MRIITRIRDYRLAHSPQTSQYDGLAPEYPLPRRTGGELPLGRRYAIAMEVALAIPLGKARVPRGSLGPICERYGVGPEYPTKLWENDKAQMDATQEVDLSSSKRTGRPSVLMPTKVAALKSSTRVTPLNGCGKASSRFTTKHSERLAITILVWNIRV